MRKIVSLIVGMFIFSGLPIISWGVDDINDFVQQPARLVYVVMMAVLSFLVVIIVPESGHSRGEGKKLVKRQKLTIFYLQIIPLLMVISAPYCDRNSIATLNNSTITRISGVVFAFIGFILMNWSVINLGKNFSVDVSIQEGHQLVTTGLYRYIRHPRYLGIIVFFLGISLVFISWLALILAFTTAAVLIWRIRDEEKLMQEEFSEEWEQYRKKTRSLIPFIY